MYWCLLFVQGWSWQTALKLIWHCESDSLYMTIDLVTVSLGTVSTLSPTVSDNVFIDSIHVDCVEYRRVREIAEFCSDLVLHRYWCTSLCQHGIEYIIHRVYEKEKKTSIALRGISELRSITCHMGSHSVTCHLTQVSVPHLNPSHAGRYSIYLPRRDGRLSWPCYSETQPLGVELATSRSRIQCANHWATKQHNTVCMM